MSAIEKHRGRWYLPSYRVLQGRKYQQVLLSQSKSLHSIYLRSMLALLNMSLTFTYDLPSPLHTLESNDSGNIINKQLKATEDMVA